MVDLDQQSQSKVGETESQNRSRSLNSNQQLVNCINQHRLKASPY